MGAGGKGSIPRRAGPTLRFAMQRDFDPNEPELMDRPQPVSSELETDLLNLVSLNRLFGSHRLLRLFLAQWLNPGRCYRVLDLATGAGDLPRAMVEWARARDITLRIDAVDANPSTVEIARKHSADFSEIALSGGRRPQLRKRADLRSGLPARSRCITLRKMTPCGSCAAAARFRTASCSSRISNAARPRWPA